MAGVGVIEDTSGHLISNDDRASDGLFKCAGVSDRRFHRIPVDAVSGGSAFPGCHRCVLGHEVYDESSYEFD